MTVEQVIMETQYMLRKINVPVELIDQIGEPIKGAVNNLQECLNAFERQKQEKKQEQEDEKIVSIEEIGGKENQ